MSKVDKVMRYLFPLLIAVAMIWYYNFNPSQSHFSIPCPWKLLTTTDCPACGFQRALSCVLHGEFLSALHYNYFFVISIPYAFLAIICSWYNFGHSLDGLKNFVFHRYTLYAYIFLFFIWWIMRNILGI